MYVFVYLYICVIVSVSVFELVCMYVCMYVYMYVCIHACKCEGVCMSECVPTDRSRLRRDRSRGCPSLGRTGLQFSSTRQILSTLNVCMYVCMCLYSNYSMSVCMYE